MASRTRRPGNFAANPAETLFGAAAKKGTLSAHGASGSPLADRIRPSTLSDVVGQAHLLAPGSLPVQALTTDRVRSMILWGPPGSGKTTIARVVAAATKSFFVSFS